MEEKTPEIKEFFMRQLASIKDTSMSLSKDDTLIAMNYS